MTKNLAENLIDLRDFGLAPNCITEFRLYHGESAFYIGTLVIMLGKQVAFLK